jgi:holo-[acyl-carrier protein] synthase
MSAPAPLLRHGIDLVEVARLRSAMERHPRFEEEVFTAGERAYCRSLADPWPHFAARFAAKEATLKALGRGLFGEGVDRALKEIEVVREGTAPALRFHGRIAAAAERAGAVAPSVSLSHDGGAAVASVAWIDARGAAGRTP